MTDVMTVLGPVPTGELGPTLMHEHLFINLMREYRGDGLLNDEDLATRECAAFRDVGGRTLVDCTNGSMGRDPLALVRVARNTGVNIVMGSGHYRVPYLDEPWLDAHTVDEVADHIIQDLTDGVGDTGVRAGIIGEVGADKWYISAFEERSFRGAARAHLRTGVPITTHAARWPVGIAQLDLLESEGVSPDAVIVGHCDTVPIPEYHLALARRGAYVQFDNIRGGSDYELDRQAEYVLRLRAEGFADRVLLSHDVCLASLLGLRGGPGFTLLWRDFIPRLLRHGMTDVEVSHIMTDNPARALSRRDVTDT